MTTSVIRAGGTGVAGVQTTGGDDGALALKVGPLDTTVEALSITTAGSVGIGTASPNTKFTVSGNANLTGNFYTPDYGYIGNSAGSYSGINTGWQTLSGGSGYLLTYVNGGEKMRIDSGGKVGIGMTPVASYGLLQVGSAVTSALGVTGLQAYVSGTNSALGQNGNLSIVTTNGQAANIGGSIGLGGKFVSAGTSVLFAHIAGRKENGTDNNSAGYLQLATQTHGGVPTEKARINSVGSVLVGATANIPVAAKIFAQGSGVGIAVGYGNGSNEYRHAYMNQDDASLYFLATANYAALNAAGVWTDASDRRIKKNIVDIKYGLEDVLKIQPRSYQMKEVAGDYIGLIAQEIEEIIPEVVSGDPEKQLTLHYGSLVAVAFKAIQEQQALIESLTNRITALEG